MRIDRYVPGVDMSDVTAMKQRFAELQEERYDYKACEKLLAATLAGDVTAMEAAFAQGADPNLRVRKYAIMPSQTIYDFAYERWKNPEPLPAIGARASFVDPEAVLECLRRHNALCGTDMYLEYTTLYKALSTLPVAVIGQELSQDLVDRIVFFEQENGTFDITAPFGDDRLFFNLMRTHRIDMRKRVNGKPLVYKEDEESPHLVCDALLVERLKDRGFTPQTVMKDRSGRAPGFDEITFGHVAEVEICKWEGMKPPQKLSPWARFILGKFALNN